MNQHSCLLLSIVLLPFCSRLVAVELRFGNSIEYVHPDEVETVQYCRKAGIGYNLNNQTSNPGGGGIVNTKEGRIIVLYLRNDHAMTVEQLKPLLKATHLSSFGCPSWATDETLGFFTHPGRFPKVTGLSIYSSKITDKGLAGLKNFPKIASLNLESDTIKMLAQNLIESCDLTDVSFKDKTDEEVIDILEQSVEGDKDAPRAFPTSRVAHW